MREIYRLLICNISNRNLHKLISHENDAPFVAVGLYLNAPIWSRNRTHFQALEKSNNIL